jgi:hypothetical protein
VARLTRGLQGFGPVYRASEVFPDKPLVKTLYPEVTTLYENFRRGATKFPQNPCLGARVVLPSGERGEYFWQSYETVQKRFLAFGSGLLNYGLAKGDHLGIYSINNPEWVIAEQACYTQGIVPISLYDTLGPDAVAFILEQAGIKVSREQQWESRVLTPAGDCGHQGQDPVAAASGQVVPAAQAHHPDGEGGRQGHPGVAHAFSFLSVFVV